MRFMESQRSLFKFDKTIVRSFHSFEDADNADRETWWSRTPLERMQALEFIRQLNYGYAGNKPGPKLQRVFRIAELGKD
jgi:hypothetical protein